MALLNLFFIFSIFSTSISGFTPPGGTSTNELMFGVHFFGSGRSMRICIHFQTYACRVSYNEAGLVSCVFPLQVKVRTNKTQVLWPTWSKAWKRMFDIYVSIVDVDGSIVRYRYLSYSVLTTCSIISNYVDHSSSTPLTNRKE